MLMRKKKYTDYSSAHCWLATGLVFIAAEPLESSHLKMTIPAMAPMALANISIHSNLRYCVSMGCKASTAIPNPAENDSVPAKIA